MRTRWGWLRLGFLLLGVALLWLLVRQAGLSTLIDSARQVGWSFFILLALYGGVHLLRTISWRLCLRQEGERLPLRSALVLWVAGEAVAYLSFGWSGEAFRAAATREKIPLERGLAALFASRMLYAYASLVLMLLGLLVCLILLPLEATTQFLFAGAALVLGVVSLLPFAGGPITNRALRLLATLLRQRNQSLIMGRVERFVTTLQHDLVALFEQDRRGFARLVGLNLLATLAGVFEVYIILRALGAGLNLPAAFMIEGISKGLALFAFFVPGNVGVREGGVILILRLFQMSSAIGVALVLVRRARALVWVSIGSLLVFLNGMQRVIQTRPPVGSAPHGELARTVPPAPLA